MSKRNKIKVGDHVVVRAECAGKYGITNSDMEDAVVLGTCLDEAKIKIMRHKDERWKGATYSVYLSDLRKTQPSVCERLIVVKSDGTDTVAIERVDGKVVKKTKARLHPNDEYKWETGRDLALNRLLYGTDYHPAEVSISPLKVFSGDAVCVRCDIMTCKTKNNISYEPVKKGKIYSFQYGYTIDEDGCFFPVDAPACIYNDKVFDAHGNAEFIPIVE